MGARTKIEWADASWNPIVGCSVVSSGCTNCYAMTQSDRNQRMHEGIHRPHLLAGGGPAPQTHYAGTTQDSNAGPVWTGKVALAPDHILTAPLRWKSPRRIFVNSMGDLFHESVPDAWIDRVFAVMALAPQHTFLVLTKRSARMRAYLTDFSTGVRIGGELMQAARGHAGAEAHVIDLTHRLSVQGKPLPHVWLGVSTEDQRRADERVPDLLATPAAVRWVSAEPLLGGIDFTKIEGVSTGTLIDGDFVYPKRIDALTGIAAHYPGKGIFYPKSHQVPRLDWIVVGGESGPNARPMHPQWARDIRDACAAAGVPFFFKQHGEWIGVPDLRRLVGGGGPGFGSFDHCRHDMEAEAVRVGKARAGRLLDGVAHNGMPEAQS